MIDPHHKAVATKIAKVLTRAGWVQSSGAMGEIIRDIENLGGCSSVLGFTWEERLVSWLEVLIEDHQPQEEGGAT